MGEQTDVALHWLVEHFSGRERLDTILRWLLAVTPAVCVSDANDQPVAFGERGVGREDLRWSTVRFACGLKLHVADPIDVPRSVFNERVDEATAFIRVLFDPAPQGRRGSGGASGGGPASAEVFAYAPTRHRGN
jgi:hypothetical protein